jgi:Flp pilus assembly protein TadD
MKFAFLKYGLGLIALVWFGNAVPAAAQDEDEFISPGGVMPAGMIQSLDPADRLAMNLRLLSQNPRDVNALTQAGISALAVGDPNAAVGFLARAEALSPSSGRVKAALGSALVMLERPYEAMRFFNEAVAFGVPERDLWKDRGLAFDLSGDPKRAQRDYELALRNGQDAEVTKRLALSFGASGDREQALRLLEPLVRRNDQGAWRARAFVLAMSGDIKGAERIVEQVMPSGSLSPFLRRLPSLSAADRSRAVNFGTMPSDGTQFASALPIGIPRPISTAASNALASATPAVTQRFDPGADDRYRKGDRRNRDPRRRPGRNDQVALATPQPATKVPSAAPAPVARSAAPGFSNEASRPVQVASVEPTDRRVGKRIGPVDAERLPEMLRPGAPTPQVTRVAGNFLPPPSGVAPAVVTRPTPLPFPPTPAPSVLAFPPPAAVVRPPVQVAALAPAPVPVPAVPVPAATVQAATVAKAPEPASVTPVPVRLDPTPAPAAVPAPAPVFEVAVIKPASPPLLTPPSGNVVPIAPAPVVQLPVASTPVAPVKVAEIAAPILSPSPFPPPTPTPTLIPGPAPDVLPPVAQVSAAPAIPTEMLTKLPPVPEPAPPAQSPVMQAKLTGPTSQEAGIAPGFGPEPAPAPASSVILADLSSTTVTPLAETQLVPASTEPAAVSPQPLGLASVIEGITPEEESRAGPLLSDTEFRRARMVAKRKAEADALAESGTQAKEDAAAKAKREEEEERKRVAAQSPARVWVQVATGSNKGGLPSTWKRIREQAPDALKGAAAWSVPFRSTNRLLVGPYKGQSEARSLVSKLSTKGVAASTFTSEAGQEIARLASR